jgi:hypothetical protein
MFKALIVAGSIAALLAAAPAVEAKEGDVIARGKCTQAATWKLKLREENGRIEAELEVDQNRVGRRWTVVLRRNGLRVFSGVRFTRAPSGSFELRRVVANGAGADRITGVARHAATGEVCRAAATWPR